MGAPAKTPELWDEVHAEARRGGTWRGIAARLAARGVRVAPSTVGSYLKIPRPAPRPAPRDPSPGAEAPDREFAEDVAAGTAELVLKTSRIIETYEDAVAAAGVDLAVWRVKNWKKKSWTVAMRVRQGQDAATGHYRPDVAIQTQQHGVQLSLERVLPVHLAAATDALFERMAKYAPKYPPVPRVKGGPGEPFLAVAALFDTHFGKLAWAPETGHSYDLREAEAVYRNAVEDVLAEAAGRPVERWLLPLGNDHLHIDNSRNTTFGGTPQDVDGRYAKVVEAAEMAVIWAVERMMQAAPVRVVWVPGNHDPTTSFHMARTVAAWFRRCDRVEVDHSPSPRKYVHWHSTLIGLTHGNEEKFESLPSLMATERPQEWAGSTCREWLLGHMHRSRQWVTRPVDTHEGTTVRALRSLAGTDAWHHRRGYVGPTRAAEVYFYGKSRGYAGHAVVPARGL